MAEMDSDEEESYVVYGNSLPPFEEGEAAKKPTPFAEQSVTDAKGRAKRFHGAFTGGFSAGFFNTVGTKEGWTPSSFVSSKEKRAAADASQQKAEQYMDEEDFSEHGIAPRKVATTDDYVSEERQRKRPVRDAETHIIPAAQILQDIILPKRQSIGVKLLRKLGWKDGQGVGPRVKRKSKKKQQDPVAGKKVYGCAMPPGEGGSDSDEGFLEGLTFAPKDLNPIDFTPKNDSKGIGYRGINPHSTLSSGHVNLFDAPSRRREKKGMRGHAFGGGALEDDDDDTYTADVMSNYDSILGGPEEDHLHGWTAPRNLGVQSKAPVGYVGAMLAGFKLASESCKPKKIYIPPHLPRNYRPVHVFTTPDPDSQEKSSSGDAGSRSKQMQDAVSERAEIIGEKPEFKSVFDLVSDKDKNTMKLMQSGICVNPPSYSDVMKTKSLEKSDEKTKPEESRSQNSQDAAPRHPLVSKSSSRFSEVKSDKVPPPAVEEARSSGTPLFSQAFQPFPKDFAKQERYDKFLKLRKQGNPDAYSSVMVDSMTEWEHEREKEEFLKAADLYKPLTGLMSTRFTPAEHADDAVNVTKKEEELSDQAKAANMKMFGKLTRERHEWHPHRDLCKRFNIPNPYPNSSILGTIRTKREAYCVYDMLSYKEPTKPSAQPMEAIEAPTEKPEEKMPRKPLEMLASNSTIVHSSGDLVNLSGHAENVSDSGPENTKEDVSAEVQGSERPRMDLFKAIFSDSESSSDDGSDDDKDIAESQNTKPQSDDLAVPLTIRNDRGTVNTISDVSSVVHAFSSNQSAATLNDTDMSTAVPSDVTPQHAASSRLHEYTSTSIITKKKKVPTATLR